MLDHASAVEDLLDFIRQNMGVVDRQGVGICLACHLPPSPRSPYPPAWLALETQIISPSVSWFTFGWGHDPDQHARTIYLSQIKSLRPRYSRPRVESILTLRDKPKLFVDSTFQSRQRLPLRHPYYILSPLLLRLRVECPYSHLPSKSAMVELSRLADICLSLSHRQIYPRPWKPTEHMLSAMKTLVGLNPDLTVWDQVYQNLSMVVSAHAALFGRVEPEEIDLLAGMRVLRDSVPWMENKLLRCILAKDGWVLKARIREEVGFELPELNKILGRLLRARAIKRNNVFYQILDPLLPDFLSGSAVSFLSPNRTRSKLGLGKTPLGVGNPPA